MTDEESGPVLSVRGEARRTVPPDEVLLPGQLRVTGDSKAAALAAAGTALGALTHDLAGLGGRALDADAGRHPLTWSAYATTTSVEREYDEQARRPRPTGRVHAVVSVRLTVRDFALLVPLGRVLAAHQDLHVTDAAWRVDHDNPGWAEVRTAAVASAVTRARDYAAALGGRLLRIDQLDDTGGRERGATFAEMRSGGGDRDDERGTPSLDPVPQEVHAAVEARFTATGVDLTREAR